MFDDDYYDWDFGLYTYQDLLALPDPTWLIHDVIPTQGFVGLYGASGSGKSFIALDWALSIATGRPWMGHLTVQAPVIYVAAEGGRGIKRRVRAWADAHGDRDLLGAYFLLAPLYVREEGAVEAFLANLDDPRGDLNPGLIVIDTLARSFGDGDENAATDMGHFIDRVVALATGRSMAVVVVHHTNVTGTRERGSGALRGAADTMFLCAATKDASTGRILLLTLSNNKQKDDVEHADIHMRPRDDISRSIVLELTEAPSKAQPYREPSWMRKSDMLLVLAASQDGLAWREWQIACGGMEKNRFNRRIKRFIDDSAVYKDGGRYFPTPTTKDLADDDDDENP